MTPSASGPLSSPSRRLPSDPRSSWRTIPTGRTPVEIERVVSKDGAVSLGGRVHLPPRCPDMTRLRPARIVFETSPPIALESH